MESPHQGSQKAPTFILIINKKAASSIALVLDAVVFKKYLIANKKKNSNNSGEQCRKRVDGIISYKRKSRNPRRAYVTVNAFLG